MSTTFALDCIADPLITPLLALLKDAVNADVRELMADVVLPDGVDPQDAIARVEPREIDIRIEGNADLPVLGCSRARRSRIRQVTMGHRDSFHVLQFRYVTPSCAVEQLSDRWPLLNAVWDSIVDTLATGHHPAHRNDVDVFDELAVTWVNLETADKQEIFEPPHLTNPAFIGQIELRTRVQPKRPAATSPTLSMHGRIYTEQDGQSAPRTPDVQVLAFTEIGQEARDAQPFDDEQELGAA